MQLRGVGALIRRVSLAKARSPFETLRSGRERARGESWRLSRCLRNYASLPERVASELPGEPLADPLRVGDSGSNAPPTLEFVAPADASPFSTFALLDASGVPLPGARPEEVMDEATALNILRTILDLQAADSVFYDAQRQGRIAFFMTSTGEEACTVAAGAALSPADRVLSQYREMGVLLARGFGLGAVADQLAGNARDVNHARQMPMHLGSRAHNFVTVSSPLATQMPHAVGHALAIKVRWACGWVGE